MRMASKKQNLGQHMRQQSDLLMDKTFSRDAGYKVCNLYDRNMNLLEKGVEVKYQFAQKYTLNKDQVEYFIQFRPGYFPEKKYINDDGIERLGFYIEIPNELDEYEFWLIIGRNDALSFKRYNILKCNWTIKYRVNNVVYSALSVLRSRNNYNSGVWSDGFATTVENQIQFLVPTNSDTNLIDYDMRFMITDNPIHPIVYEVTKVEDCLPLGTKKVTLKQTLYDPSKDNIEDKICDYFSPIIPVDSNTILPTSLKLLCSGSSTSLTLGGSARTITATFDNEPQSIPEFIWEFSFKGNSFSLNTITQYFKVEALNNVLKIAALDDKSIAGELLLIKVKDSKSYCSASIELEVKR